ncbi:Crp/Fnr family transcriptional regulator [Methylobacterium oxalidis]|uniref:Crp/Fnr family transcriptional regulator n=1 Tax=Methylobacterium oxalidis TaxID=944322 RepID=A0A512J9T3_9HYPH|nr:Crp/Fnr family transcriptional regulator [Methylobacterium oxalidis]GEP06697.1 Crp/Fnr family transcriptional regulator [Methylobacterium oxalidis]GJE32918.1 Transcriptional activatory protein AadR [Methylobacterium oxalidis]GLS67293.1 Crp/Fnr family transcriptional regulator [Methylobacterium oxalidis]
MPQHLIRKLEQFACLAPADKRALEDAAARKVRLFGPHQDIIGEGDEPEHVNLILEGWACRYKQLEDGRRQIISFFLPGDLCDPHVFVLREMDHSIGTITPVRLAEIHRDQILHVTEEHPRITQALWWEMLVTAAIQREWTVNLGQRTGRERIGHLLCELFIRLRGVGLTEGDSCLLPVTQVDLGDATGLSNVHVNRVLQELRASGLIVLRGKRLTIPDLEALQRVALFNLNYLHLYREGPDFDANGSDQPLA